MDKSDSIEISNAFERLKLIKSSNKSLVWRHFGFIERGSNLVKCIHCESTLKYSNNTTNFRTHLRNRHRGIFDSMIIAERSMSGDSNIGSNNIESTVSTIVYELVPSRLAYIPENASVCDSDKDTADNGIPVLIEGVNSAKTVSQDHASRASVSCEKTNVDEPEVTISEVSLLKQGGINRKRKNTAVDLATIAKLMKDYLEYQKESDKLFLEMEKRWQEREERLRKEDREHSLYMLKLLLAKKQDK